MCEWRREEEGGGSERRRGGKGGGDLVRFGTRAKSRLQELVRFRVSEREREKKSFRLGSMGGGPEAESLGKEVGRGWWRVEEEREEGRRDEQKKLDELTFLRIKRREGRRRKQRKRLPRPTWETPLFKPRCYE